MIDFVKNAIYRFNGNAFHLTLPGGRRYRGLLSVFVGSRMASFFPLEGAAGVLYCCTALVTTVALLVYTHIKDAVQPSLRRDDSQSTRDAVNRDGG
jgi:hypothetical protein